MKKRKMLVVILGPTAVGKTALAVDLARHYATSVISADSRQIFRELKIGVASPTQEEMAGVPHHLIGVISVEQHYSAGMFERDALQLLDALFKEHDIVVCCGGSMLYVDAMLNGLDELPSDAEVKQQLVNDYREKGLSYIQESLSLIDPEYYLEVDKNNPHRMIRALEVCRITGEKFSNLRSETRKVREFDTIRIGLSAPRAWLYERINARVDVMIKRGLIDEAKSVQSFRHHNALNTVGYKEIFDYLEGLTSLDFAIDKIKQHTRNFAKRQLTWWKRDEEINWLSADEPELLSRAIDIIDRHTA